LIQLDLFKDIPPPGGPVIALQQQKRFRAKPAPNVIRGGRRFAPRKCSGECSGGRAGSNCWAMRWSPAAHPIAHRR